MDAIADTGVPKIHFGVTTVSSCPRSVRSAPTSSVSTGGSRSTPRERVGHGTSLQGNLDPPSFAGAEFACEAARDVLRLNDGHPATSSTSATASCRQWIPTSLPRS